MPVRKRGEDEIDAVERAVVELLDHRVRISRSEVRMDGAKRLPGPAVAEQLRGRELRMRGEKPQQLAADIARGSKDGRPNHEAAPIHAICIFMQVNAYACA